MAGLLHLRAHEHPEGYVVTSLDLFQHMANLPEQADIIDELLQDVITDDEGFEMLMRHWPSPPLRKPALAVSVPSTSPEPVEGSPTNAFGNGVKSITPDFEGCKRMRHTLLTDTLIVKYVEVHGPRWRDLAKSLGGREKGFSDDVVRNRYIRIMERTDTPYKSNRTRATPRKPDSPVGRWSSADDDLIRQGMVNYGTCWSQISKAFGGARTVQAVRNRANRAGLVNGDIAVDDSDTVSTATATE